MAPPTQQDSDIVFGQLVVQQGLASPAQVEECLKMIAQLAEVGVQPLPKLGELLVRKGYLSPTNHLNETMRLSDTRTEATANEAQLPEDAAAAAVNPNNRLGKYIKVRLLGSGGMGDVWRAWDNELRRWVALKFLKHDDPEETSRFRAEAQTAAKLSHPNIAAVYEATDRYISMQLIDGPTLMTYPKEDVRKLVEIVRQAALAVQEAHDHGILHRDLKPANIMVEKDRVFVMDFGLARMMSVSASATGSGAVAGTPSYMAPEQARGEKKVDGRSDVYSLGATLYEILCGEPPFRNTDVYELLKSVVFRDPVRLRAIRPEADPELETIVMKCLEKETAQRYASARTLADDLGRWLAGEAILAHPPSTLYRVRKFVARRKAVVIPSAVALLLAVFLGSWAIMGTLTRARRLREKLAVAEDLERQSRWYESRDAFKSATEIDSRSAVAGDGLARLDQRLKEIAEAEEKKRRESEARQKAVQDATKKLEEAQPAIEKVFASLYDKETRYEDIVTRARAAQLMIEEAIRISPNLATAHHRMGRLWDVMGYGDKAEECWKKAIEVDSEFGPPHYHLGHRYMVRSFLLRLGSSDEQLALKAPEANRAAREAEREMALARGKDGFEDNLQVDVAAIMLRYVNHHCPDECPQVRKQAEEAIRKYKGQEGVEELYWLASLVTPLEERFAALDEAIRLRPRFFLAYFARGWAHRHLGNEKEAIRDWSEAIRFNPRFAEGWLSRGLTRRDKRDYRGACDDLTESIKLDPSYFEAFDNRGYALHELGDFEGAIKDHTKAIEMAPENPDPWNNRGNAKSGKGDLKGALEDLNQAINLNSRYAEAYCNRGLVKVKMEDPDGAIADFDKAATLNPRCATVYMNRGTAWEQKEEYERAIADYERGMELDPNEPGLYVNRGNARRHLGDIQGNIADWEKALRLAPATWSYRERLEAELKKLKGMKEP